MFPKNRKTSEKITNYHNQKKRVAVIAAGEKHPVHVGPILKPQRGDWIRTIRIPEIPRQILSLRPLS